MSFGFSEPSTRSTSIVSTARATSTARERFPRREQNRDDCRRQRNPRVRRPHRQERRGGDPAPEKRHGQQLPPHAAGRGQNQAERRDGGRVRSNSENLRLPPGPAEEQTRDRVNEEREEKEPPTGARNGVAGSIEQEPAADDSDPPQQRGFDPEAPRVVAGRPRQGCISVRVEDDRDPDPAGREDRRDDAAAPRVATRPPMWQVET